MNEVKHKTAAEFWKERFGESPQNDAEKLAVAMMTEYELSKELRWTTERPDYACIFVTKHGTEYDLWQFYWREDKSTAEIGACNYYLAWADNNCDEWDEIEDCDFEEYLVLKILPTIEEVQNS